MGKDRLTISKELFDAVKLKCITKERGWSLNMLTASVNEFISKELGKLDERV